MGHHGLWDQACHGQGRLSFGRALKRSVAWLARLALHWCEGAMQRTGENPFEALPEGFVFETGRDACAPEGALFFNGQLVGRVEGIDRL
jgi:hypothetical protein